MVFFTTVLHKDHVTPIIFLCFLVLQMSFVGMIMTIPFMFVIYGIIHFHHSVLILECFNNNHPSGRDAFTFHSTATSCNSTPTGHRDFPKPVARYDLPTKSKGLPKGLLQAGHVRNTSAGKCQVSLPASQTTSTGSLQHGGAVTLP